MVTYVVLVLATEYEPEAMNPGNPRSKKLSIKEIKPQMQMPPNLLDQTARTK
jgi:hypothetical protein